MAIGTAKTYYETLQGYADEYLAECGEGEATTREIAAWAIKTGRWEPPPDLILAKCKEDFAKALREQYNKDDTGRPVRAKHVARRRVGGTQQYFWADIRRTTRKHMQSAFAMRRQQIVGDCRQLDRDADYWNKVHPDDEPIQLTFDFADDIEEGKYLPEYPPGQPR